MDANVPEMTRLPDGVMMDICTNNSEYMRTNQWNGDILNAGSFQGKQELVDGEIGTREVRVVL